jgi:hypothetical protein
MQLAERLVIICRSNALDEYNRQLSAAAAIRGVGKKLHGIKGLKQYAGETAPR